MGSKAMAAKGGGGKAKGKGKAASDEGAVSSDDEEKEFDDGLDDDLIGDDADRARLEELTEKEREEELFKRAENRENLRKRFEIQKKLKLQAKKDKKAKAAAGEGSEGGGSGDESEKEEGEKSDKSDGGVKSDLRRTRRKITPNTKIQNTVRKIVRKRSRRNGLTKSTPSRCFVRSVK